MLKFFYFPTFIQLLYVDRVRHMGIILVEKTLPSYIGWTHDELKERQRMEVTDGVFGVGSLVPPIREILREIDCSKKENDCSKGQAKVPLFEMIYLFTTSLHHI